MATVMAGAIQNVIEQRIEPGFTDIRVDEDPIWMDVIKSSTKVMRNPYALGRDWVYQRAIGLGYGGSGRWQNVMGGDEVSSNLTHVASLDTPRTYPTIHEHTHSKFLIHTVRLVKYVGNIFIDSTLMRANELSAVAGDVLAWNIKGAGQKLVRNETLALYAINDTSVNNVLGVIGSVVSGGTAATHNFVEVTLSSGRVNNFYPGQLVEIWTTAGTARRNLAAGTALSTVPAAIAVVDTLDTVSEQLMIRLMGSSQLLAGTVIATDVIIAMRDPAATDTTVAAASTDLFTPYGLNDFIKNSGTLYNEGGQTGIAISSYPEYKSILATISNYLLDEHINQYSAAYEQAYGRRAPIDTFLTEVGVLTGHLLATDGQSVLERNGVERKVRMGWSVFEVTIGGRSIEVKTSPSIEKGTLYGLQLKNGGLKRLAPPPLKGAGSDSRLPQDVEFPMKAYGPSIFKPHHVNSATSELGEAPFEFWTQFFHDQSIGLKLSSITRGMPSL